MPDRILSTYDIAKSLSVDISTVSNWIDSGKLKAFRTPGGHRRVLRKDFVEFTREYKMPAANIAKGRFNILIINDNESISNEIKDTVNKNYPGTGIFKANEAFTAGKLLASEKINLVFFDINMSHMDGLSVLKLMADDPKLGFPQIIVITDPPEEAIREQIRELGIQHLLLKPVLTTNLSQLIKDTVGI